MPDDPKFFSNQAAFRKWLAAHHERLEVQWVGFYKVGTGKPSITWEESVDEALCFGWIDGLRRKIDEQAYKIRFTPRRPGSKWSAKNLASVERLIAAGRMAPAGMRVYEGRDKAKADYSYEQRRDAKLAPGYEKRFKADKRAWKYFQAQAPWYRRTAAFWVMSAKREETRERRLQRLIDASGEERPVGPLKRPT